MACSQEFIEFVYGILSPLGEVKSRKMMGDYVIYLDGKCIATACDNNLYVKILPFVKDLLGDAEIGKPYQGAKDHYILDLSNQILSRKVILELWNHLPFHKKKNSK